MPPPCTCADLTSRPKLLNATTHLDYSLGGPWLLSTTIQPPVTQLHHLCLKKLSKNEEPQPLHAPDTSTINLHSKME